MWLLSAFSFAGCIFPLVFLKSKLLGFPILMEVSQTEVLRSSLKLFRLLFGGFLVLLSLLLLILNAWFFGFEIHG